jgi:hypothetical protein
LKLETRRKHEEDKNTKITLKLGDQAKYLKAKAKK